MAVPAALLVADFEFDKSDSALLDDFACIAFQQLIAACPPSKTAAGTMPCTWADDLAKLSYYMAVSMITERNATIKVLTEILEEHNNEG